MAYLVLSADASNSKLWSRLRGVLIAYYGVKQKPRYTDGVTLIYWNATNLVNFTDVVLKLPLMKN